MHSKFHRFSRSTLLLYAFSLALATGCGSSAGGGGGVAYSGGNPGGICDPNISADACVLTVSCTSHVRCDATSQTWI